jgi:hypothetical protein
MKFIEYLMQTLNVSELRCNNFFTYIYCLKFEHE